MNAKLENAISRIADDARGRYDALLANARRSTQQAAGRVRRGKKPLKIVTRLGLKLTAVTHRTADKVLKQNTKLVEHQIDALARGLKEAAGASDLRELIAKPVRLIPENASQIATDAREALHIIASAGGEVGQILRGTADELRGKTAPVARTTQRKTVSPTTAAVATEAAAGEARQTA